MKRIYKALTIVTITVISLANWLVWRPVPAYACSCMVPPPPLEALEQASAVFSGLVTDRQEPEGPEISSADPVQVTFAVSEVWKGELPAEAVVTTALHDASCGVNFQVGQEYVVYAFDDAGGLSTNLCTRTAELSAAPDDVLALGQGTVPETAAAGEDGMVAYGLNLSPVLLLGLAVLAALLLLAVWRRRAKS